MDSLKVAINGFGRIGRITLRRLLQKQHIEVLAINDLADSATLAHLFKYDSIHGPFDGTVEHNGGELTVNGNKIAIFSESDPLQLPWERLKVDVVLECTGRHTGSVDAERHLAAGAKKVIISAPPKEKTIPTLVMGVNEDEIDLNEPILSNASCTTNNVAMLIKVLDDNWGVQSGYITTVHSYTGDQSLHDRPHRDLRRARAAATSIIPTTTGAAKAITSIFPHLDNKLGGAGIRVPVANGSLTDFTCQLNEKTTVDAINKAFKKAAESNLKGVLQYTEDPIVSVDIINNPHSCIFDAQLTSIVGGMVKVVGWYDNEFGYSSRMADLVEYYSKIENS